MDKVIETKSQMIMRIAELSEANERLERQYEDVLKLAKENADSNEYCLQELEQENERLKEKYNVASYECNNLRELKTKYRQALQEIRDMADFKCALPSTELCHCKACDYADNIINKINSVIGAEE